MAFGADLLLRFTETYDTFVLDWYSCLGAVACLIGFLFVNLDHDDADGVEHDTGKNIDKHGDDGMGDFQMLEDRCYDGSCKTIL